MCTTVSFSKKAYIRRWLNREMISATILLWHNWNDVIDCMSAILNANIPRGPPSLHKNDHGLFEQDDNTSYTELCILVSPTHWLDEDKNLPILRLRY